MRAAEGAKYAYVWKQDDFDAVDPEETDFLLGILTLLSGSLFTIFRLDRSLVCAGY